MGIRFAPSPTGKFHVGNLRTAWVSWTISRQLGIPWVCRFEDIDQPRVQSGAMEAQLADLKTLGMIPDQILIQSQFYSRHLKLFLKAIEDRQVYPCFCSRKDILEVLDGAASAPHQEVPLYHGKCRNRTSIPPVTHPFIGWRFRGESSDGSQDFIIGRTEGGFEKEALLSFVPAYHWACAIDDYDGSYTLLVRAWDLAPVVAHQRAIHSWLSHLEVDRSAPAVFHTSLVVAAKGQRLEKRTLGVTLPELQTEGWTSERLLEQFELSFTAVPEISPQSISGEDRRLISLAELFQ